MDMAEARPFVGTVWNQEAVPELVEYVRIPNKSPAFDPDWAAHGHMERAVERLSAWARGSLAEIPGARLEVVRLSGRTPVIVIELPAFGDAQGSVLLYGHLDKQPEMTGWAEGLGPWTPVIREGRLFGRGAADDGYAIFAALIALRTLARQGTPRARAIVLIEACEESGSFDLPPYIDHLSGRIGRPDLVVCLDSWCANYDQLWLTTSLRGLIGGVLTVEVLEEGVHSGDASGVAPSSFRILRRLISRLEDETSGEVKLAALAAPTPADRLAEARAAAADIGGAVSEVFPFVSGARPVSEDPLELILNRSWRPMLAVTGLAGAPAPLDAGNVMRPFTAAKLSMRLPPSVDGEAASRAMAAALTADPPYGAKVRFESDPPASGWNAPPLAPWLATALERASMAAFGAPARMLGGGGTIPFMAMLGERFPDAQFVVTGVLGPHSNAHGPNEFLDIETAKRLTLAVAQVLADHAAR